MKPVIKDFLKNAKFPETVYHYTNANAFLGIIQNKELWASHILWLSIITIFLFFASCSNNNTDDGDGLKDSEIPLEISISEEDLLFNNQTMVISHDENGVVINYKADSSWGNVSYQWYKNTNDTTVGGELIVGANKEFYHTGKLSKGIHYYYVEVEASTNIGETVTDSRAYSVAYTGLPMMYVVMDTPVSEITREKYCSASVKLFEGNKITEYSLIKKGIKGRGNSSWDTPKKGYNLNFDEKISLFDFPKSKKYCLIANYPDKTLLTNKYMSVIGNEIFNAVWNPSFFSVDLVINGEYLGNYTLCEKIAIQKGRISIQNIEDSNTNDYKDKNDDGLIDIRDGGFILEVDARHDAEFWFDTDKEVPITLKDPDEVSDDIKTRIRTVVQTAEDVLYSDYFSDIENGWRKYIDEASVIDWYLVEEFAKNTDAIFWSSVYMFYNPETERLYLGPNWDFDRACGNIDYNDCDNPEGFFIKNSIWISRMFEDELFISHLKERWNEKKQVFYNSINSTIASLAKKNKISADFNFLKWPILGTYVWTNAPGYENRTTYESEVEYMINWCNSRYLWLDTAINAL